jgi:hypothetical protein
MTSAGWHIFFDVHITSRAHGSLKKSDVNEVALSVSKEVHPQISNSN